MNERLKELRKALGFKNQQDFADALNIKRGTIANYEIGRNEPIDAVITLICSKFNVNEKWLRTGEGEMFLDLGREREIARFTKELMLGEPDSFKNRLISALAKLSVEEWEVLEKIARNMADENTKKEE